MIFFNDKIKYLFVYDMDKKEKVAIQALDTDSQIAFLTMLHHVLGNILQIYQM